MQSMDIYLYTYSLTYVHSALCMCISMFMFVHTAPSIRSDTACGNDRIDASEVASVRTSHIHTRRGTVTAYCILLRYYSIRSGRYARKRACYGDFLGTHERGVLAHSCRRVLRGFVFVLIFTFHLDIDCVRSPVCNQLCNLNNVYNNARRILL